MFFTKDLFAVIAFAGFIWATIWIFIDARRRGKNVIVSLLWAIGTLNLFIIVFPIWFIVRPDNFNERTTMCPKCKAIYKGDPFSCSTCGYIMKDGVVNLSDMDDFKEDSSQNNTGFKT
jgi:hypothetical protein